MNKLATDRTLNMSAVHYLTVHYPRDVSEKVNIVVATVTMIHALRRTDTRR